MTTRSGGVSGRTSITIVEYFVLRFSRPAAGRRLPGTQGAVAVEDERDHRELFQIAVGEIGRRIQQDRGFAVDDVQNLRVVQSARASPALE